MNSTPRQKHCYANSMHIVVAGCQGIGKSTLLNILRGPQAYLTEKSDNTDVSHSRKWVLGGNKRNGIPMVELGDHDLFQATGHYIYEKGSTNVTLLCHDILSTEYDSTFKWLESIIYISPRSHSEFILTKAEMLKKEEDHQEKIEGFLQELKHYLYNQYKLLNKAVQQHTLDEDHRKSIENALEKYQKLENQSDLSPYVVSCMVDYYSTVDKVKVKLQELSETLGNTVCLREEHQLLYEAMGKVGNDVSCMTQVDHSSCTTAKSKCKKKKPLYKKIWNKIRRKKSAVQEKWVKSSPQISQVQKAQCVKLDEAVGVYKEILEGLSLTTERLEEQTKEALVELSDHGFVLYFRESERLAGVIFKELQTFVNVLKCIPYYGVDESFECYEDELVKNHKGVLDAGIDFQNDIMTLNENGVMTKKLLQCLLDKWMCVIEIDTMMALLDEIELGYHLQPNKPTIVQQKNLSL